MRRGTFIGLVILVALSPRIRAQEHEVPKGYELRTIRGFTTLISEKVLAQRTDRYGRKPLDVLNLEFSDLNRVVAPRILQILQQVPVWVEWDEGNSIAANAIAV